MSYVHLPVVSQGVSFPFTSLAPLFPPQFVSLAAALPLVQLSSPLKPLIIPYVHLSEASPVVSFPFFTSLAPLLPLQFGSLAAALTLVVPPLRPLKMPSFTHSFTFL